MIDILDTREARGSASRITLGDLSHSFVNEFR